MRTSVDSEPIGSRFVLPDLALACIAGLAAAVVFRGALHYGFSQDDFVGLARAAGLLPRLAGPWRFLSHQAYFDVMRALAALDARRYHLVSLAAHGLATGLVFAWLRRWTSRAAALVGATFFGAHVAAFTALYWAAAFGDVGALACALAALLALERRDAWRWLALPLFAASLGCKESTLFLPAVAWAAAGARGRWKDPAVAGLAVVAAVFAAWLAAAGSGTAPTGSSAAPYAIGVGANVGANLLTYAGWATAALSPVLHGFSDGLDPGAFAAGAVLLAVIVAGNFAPALRARGWTVASVWVLALLAPVLVLTNHVYHYYLYAALPGVGWLVAIAFDAAVARSRAPRPGRARARRGAAWPWAAAGGLAAALVVNGAALVARVETAPLFGAESRADPTVDRALVAARAVASVRAAHLPRGTRIAFWSPAAVLAHGDPGPVERYAARNVRDSLEGGLGVRVLCPEVAGCAFVDAPAPTDPPGERVALFHADGAATIVPRAALDSLLAEIPR